jgi:hypothetical protein
MKIVVYYEGEAEEAMLDAIRYRYTHVNWTKDYYEFLTWPDSECTVLLWPCGGYQNVFPQVESTSYLYENEEVLLIIRDLERTPCYSGLKAELEEVCTNLPPALRVKCMFSRPEFEELYFCDLSLFRHVFARMYHDTYNEELEDQAALYEKIMRMDPRKPEASIKQLFSEYGMAYKKPKFSKIYCTQLDFDNIDCVYLQRLRTVFLSLFPQII